MHSSSWQHYLQWLCYEPTTGLALDLSRMGVTRDDAIALRPALDEAHAAMLRLESGAIANRDEQRMVGHYWLRNSALAPDPQIADEIERTIAEVVIFAKAIHQGEITGPSGVQFAQVLCIGIGGSALGPQFVADALSSGADSMAMHFIDNTDPDGIDRTIGRLDSALEQTLVVVISKSGGTAETRNGMLEVSAAFDRAKLSFARQAVAITGVGSKLDQLAQSDGWLKRLPMWDWVGGRTSQTSVVGLLPAALQGIDIQALLAGAGAMDAATRSPQLNENPAALLALAWYHAGNGRGDKAMVLLPYKDRLALFSRYLQQLVMESLGKANDLDGKQVEQGIAVYGNKGSTDQHAYVQQLRDGRNDFFVTFLEVLQGREGTSLEVEPGVTASDYLSGFLHGTRQALSDAGRLSLTVTVPLVDAHVIGALIALYERAVGLYANLVNINAYHQPGVEAGKVAAGDWLRQQQALLAALSPQGQAIAALAEQISASTESVFQLGRHLAANRDDVVLDGDPAKPDALVLRVLKDS